MSRNSYNSHTVQLGKVVVLELLGHSPRNEIPGRSHAALELLSDSFLTNFTFERDLDRAEDVGERVRDGAVENWAHEHEDLVSGCV